MVTRLLLALLALLTGLSVQIAPAQARAGGVSAVGASVAVVRPQRLARQVQAAGMTQAVRPRIQHRCLVAAMATEAICPAPVLLGIDRAHE